MRELTISELKVVSGGNLGKLVTDIVVGWSAGEAAEATANLLAQGLSQLREAIAEHNKNNPIPLTQKDIDALEKVLEEAAEEREKNTTDYCGCGGGYSD
ncbi:hypothetical protein [Acinetobacter guillouiae]|uniref:hypothetical protein n=1 Tax=Acinetobacter guillouiae TaxID=106649 RepID=UPI002FD87EF2